MKDCTTCKYGFVDEQFGFPMCHHPLRFSEDCVDFNMHEEIEEPEKATGVEEKKLPEGLEEAAEKSASQYYVDGGYSPFPNVETAAHEAGFIAGAEWQKAKMMEDAAKI